MHYIVVKPFAFAGDQYKTGDVFEPSKYPASCDSRKLARMVSTRRLVEDFKLPIQPVAHVSEDAETSHEEGESAPEMESVKRSKGAK